MSILNMRLQYQHKTFELKQPKMNPLALIKLNILCNTQ